MDNQLIMDPIIIKKFLFEPRDISPPEAIFIVPYITETIELQFSNEEQLKPKIDQINALVDAVEKEDPWVKKEFNVSGVGEGIVWYPISKEKEGKILLQEYSKLVFKTKGVAHSVVQQTKSAQLHPETAQNANQFVDIVVTPARLEQALSEGLKGEVKEEKIRAFVDWIWRDVKKECEAEINASGLTWREVGDLVKSKARKWFLAKLMTSST